MVLRQIMYVLIFQGLLKTFMPRGYEVIISTTFRNVSKTYGVYVNFSDVASAVNVLTISILYSAYKYRYNNILHIIWFVEENMAF